MKNNSLFSCRTPWANIGFGATYWPRLLPHCMLSLTISVWRSPPIPMAPVNLPFHGRCVPLFWTCSPFQLYKLWLFTHRLKLQSWKKPQRLQWQWPMALLVKTSFKPMSGRWDLGTKCSPLRWTPWSIHLPDLEAWSSCLVVLQALGGESFATFFTPLNPAGGCSHSSGAAPWEARQVWDSGVKTKWGEQKHSLSPQGPRHRAPPPRAPHVPAGAASPGRCGLRTTAPGVPAPPRLQLAAFPSPRWENNPEVPRDQLIPADNEGSGRRGRGSWPALPCSVPRAPRLHGRRLGEENREIPPGRRGDGGEEEAAAGTRVLSHRVPAGGRGRKVAAGL